MKIRNWTMTLLILVLSAVTIFGCKPRNRNTGGGTRDGGEGATIRIGSKNFTEQLLLGEMMAQMIEAHTDLTVQRTFNLGGTMICHNALKNGELDLYAEYTGTALTAILKKEVISDPDAAYQVVDTAYQEQLACDWLQPFGFNNTYAVTMRRAEAQANELQTISDLKSVAGDMSAGFTAEFMERPDGYPGLTKTYGLDFESTRDMEPALMYQAIAQENVDVICAFATDGRIAKYNLRMLTDDKGFFPPYYAAPVVREETLEQHPELKKILNRLGGKIDNKRMQQLNNQVDEDGRAAADVVADFLKEEGLLASAEAAVE